MKGARHVAAAVMANAIRMRILKLMRIFYSLRGEGDGGMKSPPAKPVSPRSGSTHRRTGAARGRAHLVLQFLQEFEPRRVIAAAASGEDSAEGDGAIGHKQ